MLIDPKSSMFGHPTLVVRDFVKKFPSGEASGASYEGLDKRLSKDEAAALVGDLVAEGYLSPDPSNRFFHRTHLGNRLANASGRPLKRINADKMLKDLLARAGAINSNPDYCYEVRSLVVFGSYLDPAREVLGDLDVAYMIEKRFSGKDQERAEESSRAKSKRSFNTFVDRLCWPETSVLLALKARTPGLSLHSLTYDQAAIFSGAFKVVLGDIPPHLGKKADWGQTESTVR